MVRIDNRFLHPALSAETIYIHQHCSQRELPWRARNRIFVSKNYVLILLLLDNM